MGPQRLHASSAVCQSSAQQRWSARPLEAPLPALGTVRYGGSRCGHVLEMARRGGHAAAHHTPGRVRCAAAGPPRARAGREAAGAFRARSEVAAPLDFARPQSAAGRPPPPCGPPSQAATRSDVAPRASHRTCAASAAVVWVAPGSTCTVGSTRAGELREGGAGHVGLATGLALLALALFVLGRLGSPRPLSLRLHTCALPSRT